MALITCPECGGSASSLAKTCPHCGYPFAPKKRRTAKKEDIQQPEAAQVSNPAPAPQPAPMPQPAPAPQPAPVEALEQARETADAPKTVSVPTANFGRILMLLLGLVAFVIVCVFKGKGMDVSHDLVKTTFGGVFTLLALFFLVQMLKPGSKEIQRFLGFLGAGLALLEDVVLLAPYSHDMLWLYENMTYFEIALDLVVVLYALTLDDLSKYVMLAAGLVCISSQAYGNYHLLGMSSEVFIAICVFGGICFLGMLANWTMEATGVNRNLLVRMIAALMAMLMIATIIVVAVKVKDVLDGYWYNAGDAFKLIMGFVLAAGASSLFFSVALNRNGFLRVTSALFFVGALLLLIAKQSLYGMDSDKAGADLFFSSLFMLPLAVMAVQVAPMLGGLKGKITITKA